MDSIIKIEKLNKNYKSTSILKELSMEVRYKDVYGFIGKNGVGKTTTIKILLGLTSYSTGEISLFNSKDEKSLIKNRELLSGIVEEPAFYPNMTARENLKYYCILRNIDSVKIEETLNIVGLDNIKKKKVKNFSLGMKQRLGIARAILANSKLIILDEPTNGLDPEGIIEFRSLVKKLNEENNITFVISSHYLDELQKVCNKFGVLKDGKIIEEVDKKTFLENRRGFIIVEVLDIVDVEYAKKVISNICNEIEIIDGIYLKISNENIDMSKIIEALSKNDILIKNIETKKTVSIEEYLLKIMDVK